MSISGSKAVMVAVAAIICFPGSAYCYIDLGSGSMMVQMLIAGLVGGVFAVKIFFKRIVKNIRKLFGKDNADVPK
jgi:hypothetical protein